MKRECDIETSGVSGKTRAPEEARAKMTADSSQRELDSYAP
jgi:hypothetical protein